MSRRAAPPLLVEPCRGRLQHVLRCTPEVGTWVEHDRPDKQYVVRWSQVSIVNHPEAFLVVLQLGTSLSSWDPRLLQTFWTKLHDALVDQTKSSAADGFKMLHNKEVYEQLNGHPFCFILYPEEHCAGFRTEFPEMLKRACNADSLNDSQISTFEIGRDVGNEDKHYVVRYTEALIKGRKAIVVVLQLGTNPKSWDPRLMHTFWTDVKNTMQRDIPAVEMEPDREVIRLLNRHPFCFILYPKDDIEAEDVFCVLSSMSTKPDRIIEVFRLDQNYKVTLNTLDNACAQQLRLSSTGPLSGYES